MAKGRKIKKVLSGKLKGLGMIAVALAFAGVVGWGVVGHRKAAAYRSTVSEQEAQDVTDQRNLHEAKLNALPDDELAKKTDTVFFPKGGIVTFDGYLLTRQQNISCDGCLSFQAEYQPKLTEAIDLKHLAMEDRDKALRGKRRWKMIAFVGGGIVAGIIIDRKLRK